MNARNGQTAEYTTRDKVVWGKWRTYSGVRRIAPQFQYKTEPRGYYGNYYIQDMGSKKYAVAHDVSGYFSLKEGGVPGRKDFLFSGVLPACKKWLVDFIRECYGEQPG